MIGSLIPVFLMAVCCDAAQLRDPTATWITYVNDGEEVKISCMYTKSPPFNLISVNSLNECANFSQSQVAPTWVLPANLGNLTVGQLPAEALVASNLALEDNGLTLVVKVYDFRFEGLYRCITPVAPSYSNCSTLEVLKGVNVYLPGMVRVTPALLEQQQHDSLVAAFVSSIVFMVVTGMLWAAYEWQTKLLAFFDVARQRIFTRVQPNVNERNGANLTSFAVATNEMKF